MLMNINNPTLYNVGFIGQGKYNSKTGKIYIYWKSMFQRCYSINKQEKYPTYIGCTVDERWYNFQVFAEWFEQNYIEGFQLDKDILIKGNKVYGPDTCCFVPAQINSLFIKSIKKRGKYPIGITFRNNKFQVNFKKFGESKYFGSYSTINKAFEIYAYNKKKHIIELTEYWKDYIKPNVYQALINYQVEITD